MLGDIIMGLCVVKENGCICTPSCSLHALADVSYRAGGQQEQRVCLLPRFQAQSWKGAHPHDEVLEYQQCLSSE